ncbi:MAG: rRNA maturation RNase YbeY [Acidobacteriota bacterium]
MSPDGSSILFQGVKRSIPLDRRRLRLFEARLTAEVAAGRPFTVLVTNDAALQRLNREFLQHDYPTDVLSFPGEEELGEMAISADRAAEQAAEYGHDVTSEVEILMLHGLLHLLGHDHETDRGKMRRLDTKWRQTLGLPAGLIERTKKP